VRSACRLIVGGLVLSVALAACGGDDGAGGTATTASPTTTTTTTITTTTSPASTTTSAPSSEALFGWVRSFEDIGGAVIVGVDRAEMLTGAEALAAARQDGFIGADEDLPNDFYIRNPDDATVDLDVSADVVVTLQACYQGGECVTTEEVDLATWSVLFGAEEDPGLEWDWYGAGALPYQMTLVGGLVTEIQEVYLP
jgi:hypothetical protein